MRCYGRRIFERHFSMSGICELMKVCVRALGCLSAVVSGANLLPTCVYLLVCRYASSSFSISCMLFATKESRHRVCVDLNKMQTPLRVPAYMYIMGYFICRFH